MTQITEQELIFPALVCLTRHPDGLTTTELSGLLRELVRPTGHDLEPLEGRDDDIFSQKVRNLKSHNTLRDTGLVDEVALPNNTLWKIRPEGTAFVEDRAELLDLVQRGAFTTAATRTALTGVTPTRGEPRRRVVVFDEDAEVEEGVDEAVTVNRRTRSRQLRAAAIAHFTRDGRIACVACGFDFRAAYGERGDGFIEIHHRKPLSMYEDEDLRAAIGRALENLAPLCSNCHRMTHRRGAALAVDELTDIVAANRNG